MQLSEAYQYLHQSERRRKIMLALKQPLTARQLSRRTGMSLDACSRVLNELSVYDLVRCMNPDARQSRVYWLTAQGEKTLIKLQTKLGYPHIKLEIPSIDWDLFGWVCYRHRRAVLLAITEPIQPSAIKRKARSRNLQLSMSANNVRDVIRLFKEKGVVRPVQVGRKAHLRYELTNLGRKLRELLIQAELHI